MFARLRTVVGVLRSLRIYYGDRRHGRALDQLYGRFVKQGDLVFDIGAHVGDRVASFRRLGARIIAVEPQPALARTLRFLFGRDERVTIAPMAVGREPGIIEMRLNLDNPTISTASDAFIAAAAGADGWRSQRWSKVRQVSVTTLDALIAVHGMPAFIKIDVEGFEGEVLAGLTRPPPVLSFEFTLIQRELARDCLQRCTELGYTSFNAVLGESCVLHPDWVDAGTIDRWLAGLPPEANSGDIYARGLQP